jgi:hypothetical protein
MPLFGQPVTRIRFGEDDLSLVEQLYVVRAPRSDMTRPAKQVPPAWGGSSSTESGTGEQSLDRRLHCERLGKAGQTVLAAFDQRDPLRQLIDLAART